MAVGAVRDDNDADRYLVVTRVLVVDDERLVRAGLRMILQSATDIQVVGEAADGSEVPAAVAAHRPDVVLMDIRMPTIDGLAATTQLIARPNAPKVLVLTTFDLFADTSKATRKSTAQQRLSTLTDRESEVLIAVGRGGSNAQIGRELFLSEATVKAHVSKVLDKTGATNRVQVAILAHEAGLLD